MSSAFTKMSGCWRFRVTVAWRNWENRRREILISTWTCHDPCLELWAPANKLMKDIATSRQVLETPYRKSGKLLTSLTPLWMKFFSEREKGY
jgi:hypothetical protein